VAGARAQGATEEVARDSAIVTVDGDAVAKWLRPRCEVSLTIELPATHGLAPRALACGAVIRNVDCSGTRSRVELRIVSMEFRRCCE
jgi:hypothetical protein